MQNILCSVLFLLNIYLEMYIKYRYSDIIGIIFFFFNSIIWIYKNLFIHSNIDENLDYFQFAAIINNATKKLLCNFWGHICMYHCWAEVKLLGHKIFLHSALENIDSFPNLF